MPHVQTELTPAMYRLFRTKVAKDGTSIRKQLQTLVAEYLEAPAKPPTGGLLAKVPVGFAKIGQDADHDDILYQKGRK